ncbi:amino acid adenylation domain-containing protein/thioester reductase-like protein [Catenuloplanes nepalensis]|uniref:Amino acid adenylation domain-containing protein/thioester reductase-like protein n=1 Tax=Catenuloplanes nepalensis TaxID=587533 RepID=A0ABT9N1S5_9ACTN|nr:amino acid adenylation domain-containing protein [Catenuloplanes nepalensis]MDP9797648.1 amino acid adenylation domain-containing protein/thioester reductase-like protein [Catenuloplanes nepalensis]
MSMAVLFRRQVARTPAAIAVVHGGRQITYAELNRASDLLATHLVASGVRPGEQIGILGDRCLEAPVAMLGIVKAGGVYVPLDPRDPAGRLDQLVGELSLARVVALPGEGAAPAGISVSPVMIAANGRDPEPVSVARRGGDALYVLFTSGTTGVPKAVAVPHRAVARLALAAGTIRITAADRVSATGRLTFDASVFEIWGALLNGAALVVVDDGALLDPERLAALLMAERVTVSWLTAGIFHQCAQSRPAMFARLRCLITGGDVLRPDLVRRVLATGPPGALLNGYGPTENTVFSTTYRVSEVRPGAATIPIGRPVDNSSCLVVNDAGVPAGVGEEGELWVGGDGIALGYLNDEMLTADRFVPDPSGQPAGGRMFRTGDRARWLPSGDLDFLGRRDRMVKLRGMRVELDEIEAVLARAPGVAEAAVTLTAGDPDHRAIIAYYVPERNADAAGGAELRDHLARRLPAFMVPSRILPVARMPLSGSGKVDRTVLASAPNEMPGRAPSTPTEVGMARIWAEVLEISDDELTAADDFFALGGNSLLAARVFARLRTTFGIDPAASRFLTVRLLADPTLAGCALAVEEVRAGAADARGGAAPLDLWREARAASVPLEGFGSRVPRQSARDVFLTGATGFLGSYLLRRLVERTDARVVCLVRAEDDAHGLRRLAAAQAAYGLGQLPADRVVAVTGDLGAPGLGMSDEDADRVARQSRFVLHAGAYVNFTYPFERLAAVTVHGTREIVRLAGRHGRVPVHFVSTLAVLSGFGAVGIRDVGEDTPLAHPEQLAMGYTESKWVAEQVLARAAADGLPVSVHRPYEVSGDLVSGAWNLENATCALFRLIVDLGLAPDVDVTLDLVPVDVLAAQIVHIALHHTAGTRTYHLANPRPAMLGDLVQVLRAQGYPVRFVPLPDWVAAAIAHVCDHPEHPFTPFIPLWVDRSPSGMVVKELYFRSVFPHFGRVNAERALFGSGIRMPPVDAALLEHYVRFFRRSGFFPPATAAAR